MPSVGLLFRVAIMPGRLSPHQMQPGGALADIEQGVGAGTRAASIKKRDKRHRWKQATRSMGLSFAWSRRANAMRTNLPVTKSNIRSVTMC